MSASIQWTGVDDVLNGMKVYEEKVRFANEQVARFWQAVFEEYAKANASWTDRTANARQTLAAYLGGEAPQKPGVAGGVEYPDTQQLAKDTVELYLSHGVNYGLFLETMAAGRWAIIWETIDVHLPQIRQMLNQVFG